MSIKINQGEPTTIMNKEKVCESKNYNIGTYAYLHNIGYMQ